jgi:hypothetical protein
VVHLVTLERHALPSGASWERCFDSEGDVAAFDPEGTMDSILLDQVFDNPLRRATDGSLWLESFFHSPQIVRREADEACLSGCLASYTMRWRRCGVRGLWPSGAEAALRVLVEFLAAVPSLEAGYIQGPAFQVGFHLSASLAGMGG